MGGVIFALMLCRKFTNHLQIVLEIVVNLRYNFENVYTERERYYEF